MADIVDSQTRSRMMAGIHGKNSQPEIFIRKFLHAQGYRFRLHRKDLPGRPDLVLPKYHLAIFVHGCFWHSHKNCKYSTSPSTREEFWKNKLAGNEDRDKRQRDQLYLMGWRVLTIWECGLKHCTKELDQLNFFIQSAEKIGEWPRTPPRPKN